MKIVIISQNAYPFQSPRAFRASELAEQLAKRGNDVTHYSIHGSFNYDKYENETGVKMRKISTHYPLSANDGNTKYNWFQRLKYHFLHRLFFYPECVLHFKVKSILKKENNVDLLITVAYPHSIHSGAASYKQKRPDSFPKMWIADCGDPFCLNPFFSFPKYFERIERRWCSLADYITIPIEEGMVGYFPEYHNKIRVIPQGFDFSKTPTAEYRPCEIPTFAYAGSLYGKRDPRDFLQFLSTLDFPFVFYLFTHKPINAELKNLLGDKLKNIVGKNRKECIFELGKMDFLINFTNPTAIQSPSKLIDYGIAGRPILDVKIPFTDSRLFMDFLHGNYGGQHRIENLDRYRIENVVDSFLNLTEDNKS